MLRLRYFTILLLALPASLPAAAEALFPEFMDEAGSAIGITDQGCPAAETAPWIETGQFATCAGIDPDFKRFRKRWRRLLEDSASFHTDPGSGWDRMTSGIRTNQFWYQGFPGNVYFDENQGRVFFTIRATISACPGADPMLPGTNETVYRVGSPQVIKPEKSVSVAPRFPPSLLKVRQGGSVILRSIIDRSGVPTRICVLKADPDNQSMKDSAMDAVKLWRYSPALKDDAPVPFYLTIQVNFSIQ